MPRVYCEACKVEFHDWYANLHNKVVHPEAYVNALIYECDQCEGKFQHKYELEAHLEKFHQKAEKMPADVFFNDVTAEAIEQANKMLEFLLGHTVADWQTVLKTVLSPVEYELNIKNVNKALEDLHVEAPVGAIAKGTGMVKAEAGLAGEDSQRAVRLLKQTGRLLQAGKGRGKALVVLSSVPLQPQDFAAAVAKAGVAEPAPTVVKPVVAGSLAELNAVRLDDVNGLVEGIRTYIRSLENRIDELTKGAKVDKETLKEQEKEIAQLRDELSERASTITTWA